MMIVTTNGTILDVLGPYPATMNDATITENIFNNHQHIRNFFKPGDVQVVDRGFRDCISTLNQLGFEVKLPAFLDNGAKQLTTKQANESRIVTKCRFVIEVRNGHLKNVWRLFGSVWNTYNLKYIKNDLKIAAALINKFNQKIVADKGCEEEVAQLMLQRINKINEFARIVKK